MRSSARTPPHSQVSPSPRSPDSPPLSHREDWSPGQFYKTMRRLYRRDRQNPDSLVEIPFHANRSLSHAEFWACAEQYCWARRNKYLAQLVGSQQGRRPQSPKSEQWPDLEGLGLSPKEFWKYEKALGQLYFAETKQRQTQARERINKLATRGLNDLRQAVAKARCSILQAKRTLSGRDRFNLIDYRAKRQFLWRFLRAESEWERGQKKEGRKFDKTVQALAKAYSYLDLTPATIAEGLRDPHQADTDAATHFTQVKHLKISASSVRSLTSKSLHR